MIFWSFGQKEDHKCLWWISRAPESLRVRYWSACDGGGSVSWLGKFGWMVKAMG